MALKKVKRFVTRNEAKDGSRQARRKADKNTDAVISDELECPNCGDVFLSRTTQRCPACGGKVRNESATAQPDVRVTNHGSIWLIHPMNGNAWTWLSNNLATDCPRFGDSFAVEARYISDILDGLTSDGFTIA